MSNLPGALDPGRIGQLSWAELPFRPTQDHVVVKLEPPAEVSGGVIIPASAQAKRGELVPALVVATGPGAYDTQGRLIPMQLKAGDRVLVDGDCGWILGPHRVIRQGAVEAVFYPASEAWFPGPGHAELEPEARARRDEAVMRAIDTELDAAGAPWSREWADKFEQEFGHPPSKPRDPVDQAERIGYGAAAEERHRSNFRHLDEQGSKAERPDARHPVDQAERDEYLARHKADLEARKLWLEKQEKP